MSYTDLSVFRGPHNHLCAAIAGMNLHSQMDPVRESQRLCASASTQAADTIILFGLGLGYVVEALCTSDAQRPVILIEPEIDWIDQAIALRREAGIPLDLAAHAGLSVIRCNHPDDLVMVLQDLGSRNPALIANPAIQKLRSEEYSIVIQALSAYRERFQVNVNTLQRFGHLWVRNLARNLHYLADCPGVNLFADKFKGIPGLLVAGGPSLDAIIPALAELRQRMIIVAVDTSLRACLRAGIDPDFVVMVDPQYWNTRHLDGCSTSKARVISESSVFPRSLRQTAGPIYLCSSLFPLGQYFEQFVGTKGALGAGGSVATTAWDFMRYIGIHQLFTAGLDLSFPNGQTHFQGSVFEEACHRDATRLNPAAQLRYGYLHNGGTYSCISDLGQTVLSDRRMDIYVHWFENQSRMHPEVTSYRIGSGSRSIEGFSQTSLGTCLELPVRREIIDSLLSSLQLTESSQDQRGISDCQTKLQAGRQALLGELRELRATATQALVLITQAKSAKASTSEQFNAVLKELDILDAQVIGTGNRRIAGFLIENLIQEISTANRAETMEQALQLSTKLYSGLRDACDFHIGLFSDS